MTFGIIGEGNSDQTVVERILMGFFNDPDLLATPLHPVKNAQSGWNRVCKYVASDEFRGTFSRVDFVVIQMDSDVFLNGGVKQFSHDLNGKTIEQTVLAIRDFLIKEMTEDVFEEKGNRIVFAISVNCLECWFVPIYYENVSNIQFETDDCLKTLRPHLLAKHRFVLTKKKKAVRRYEKISDAFLVKEDLTRYSMGNASLSIFLSELEEKTRTLEPDLIEPAP